MAVDIRQDSAKKELQIKVAGRFDFGVHQDFRKATDMIDNSIKSIVIDLQQTDYVDSSALGMLLVLRDKMSEARQAIKIINVQPEVKKILQIANFDKLFMLS